MEAYAGQVGYAFAPNFGMEWRKPLDPSMARSTLRSDEYRAKMVNRAIASLVGGADAKMEWSGCADSAHEKDVIASPARACTMGGSGQ